MARKNKTSGWFPKITFPKNTHLLYSTDELHEDNPTVVRYMGEQNRDEILVFFPEGYALWVKAWECRRSRSSNVLAMT